MLTTLLGYSLMSMPIESGFISVEVQPVPAIDVATVHFAAIDEAEVTMPSLRTTVPRVTQPVAAQNSAGAVPPFAACLLSPRIVPAGGFISISPTQMANALRLEAVMEGNLREQKVSVEIIMFSRVQEVDIAIPDRAFFVFELIQTAITVVDTASSFNTSAGVGAQRNG